MRYAMPNPELVGRTYYLRIRVPNDLVDSARGTMIAVRVGSGIVTVRVGDVVKVSLRTIEPAEGKRRFTQALASVEAHWESLRRTPTKLSHKQCVALAGEMRRDWVEILDENPGDPRMWQNVQRLNAEALRPKPHPYAELMVGELPPPSNAFGLEERFGGFADAILRRHNLVVEETARARLLPLIAVAMLEATDVIIKKAQGDYSDSGETSKYPKYQPQQVSDGDANAPNGIAMSFFNIIDEENRRRSLGREGKPLPERTARKFRNAAVGFTEFRGSDDALSVTPEEVEGWKLNLLEENELSNNTIAQRLQNISTVMQWGQLRCP